jgi:hypothetical protein
MINTFMQEGGSYNYHVCDITTTSCVPVLPPSCNTDKCYAIVHDRNVPGSTTSFQAHLNAYEVKNG